MSALPLTGKFGYGTMSLTWTHTPAPIEQAVESMNYVTSHPEFGVKLLNGGAFYGKDYINLKYIKAFVDTLEPEAARELTVCIKGAVDLQTILPIGTKESVDKSISDITSYFSSDPSKRPKILFEIARVDPNVPYEETVSYIYEHVKSGKIDGISLSEVGPASIAKATAVAPISCVEMEFSILCQDLIDNGVLDELKKQNIPIVAYSPLCRGYLTDYCAENPEEFFNNIKPGDIRMIIDKFSKENFPNNHAVVKKLYDYAHEVKGMTLESFSLSWIQTISEKKNYKGVDFVKILPIPSGSTKEKIEKNLGSIVQLTDDDLEAVDKILKEQPVTGMRYNAHHAKYEFA
ncbi:Aldo/keto reductase [Suhomyces tanzawaensis NRRL Y-17324]|uniref:Aldo/keto reductase n=1 Tax=Suhomyces tanzawaensis NRRL Y-17324 TaxID=984487 RepID=A0A1E4SNN0_9ASCO|nr:Aldo/keto reductase [Suhomyces tanzawaensis NRRL Y-17324]ODV81129.1 Aldo/keto reductase [Suhomyces tanzawaensis NRRL Y-17324]